MEGPTQGFGLVLRRKPSGSEMVSHQNIDMRVAVESRSDYFRPPPLWKAQKPVMSSIQMQNVGCYRNPHGRRYWSQILLEKHITRCN